LNFRPAWVWSLFILLLALPSHVTALGSASLPSGKMPCFVHVINSNSGASISGALVWLDGVFAGAADSFGNVGLSVTRPPTGHSYVVSASGYQVAKGTFAVGSSNVGQVIVRLLPIPTHR
jgi:hypothetical protein